MEGAADESGSIRGGGQGSGQLSIHKVGHPLCRCSLLVVALLPAGSFQFFLPVHHGQRVISSLYVFRPEFHHHSAVAPFPASVAGTHAIDHQLFGTAGSRYDKSSGAHAETVHASAVHLSDHAVFGCRQPLASSLAAVVLNLVDEVSRMLQSHSHSQSLAFQMEVSVGHASVHIPCRMTCGQDDGIGMELLLLSEFGIHGHQSSDASLLYEQVGHARLEMNLSSAPEDGLSHIFYHPWQSVCADVWMCIRQDTFLGTVLYEYFQDTVGISPFLAACIEFAVAVRACAALAKGIVALGIHLLVGAYACHIFLPLSHILSALDDHGAQTQFDEAQCSKESSRTSSHHQHTSLLAYIPVLNGAEEHLFGLFVQIDPYGEVDIDVSLSGIYAPPQYPDGLWLDALVLLQKTHDALLVISILR